MTAVGDAPVGPQAGSFEIIEYPLFGTVIGRGNVMGEAFNGEHKKSTRKMARKPHKWLNYVHLRKIMQLNH